ncbi:hypothetical protein ABT272_31195 [Streptomyces sp900105245]|uniref:Uncharacterized protein n=1 Tax=Streptomyces sp. 900105245 TaxID=3154379 RepID=A0ABV1UEM1_9ACTN
MAGIPELAKAFSESTAATWPGTGAVIEPLLEGIEATAYTAASPTGPTVVAVSHTTFDSQAELALVPAEVVVDADDVCVSTIEATASRALAALGHSSGPAQIRMRISPAGPRVITITTHLTDPLAAMLIEQVTGTDLICEAGHQARGRTSMSISNESRLGATAVPFLQGPDASHMMPRHAAKHLRVTPYATLQQYPAAHRVGPLQRGGHLLVSGTDYPQCIARLRSGVAAVVHPPLSA